MGTTLVIHAMYDTHTDNLLDMRRTFQRWCTAVNPCYTVARNAHAQYGQSPNPFCATTTRIYTQLRRSHIPPAHTYVLSFNSLGEKAFGF